MYHQKPRYLFAWRCL